MNQDATFQKQGSMHLLQELSERKVKGDWFDRGLLFSQLLTTESLIWLQIFPATELPKVREGQNIEFTVDGLPGKTFTGSIKRVNPMVTASDRSGRIQAEVKNPDGLLKRRSLYQRGKNRNWRKKTGSDCSKETALMSLDIEKALLLLFAVKLLTRQFSGM